MVVEYKTQPGNVLTSVMSMPRLVDVEITSRCSLRYSILSNGGLITDELAAFLAGTHRYNYVQVSVDGSHPEPQHSALGQGSFQKAIRGIRVLPRVRIHPLLHRELPGTRQ